MISLFGKYMTMTLPSTGPLHFSQVDVELGLNSNNQLNLGNNLTRQLAGVLSGPISMSQLYGRSSFTPIFFTSSTSWTSTQTLSLRALVVGGGAGGGSGYAAGGGGAGEAVTTSSFLVQPGDVVTITVGTGGAVGSRGMTSSIINTRTAQTVAAVAGYPGSSANITAGGGGGISISPQGQTFYGGAGSNSGGQRAGGGGAGADGAGHAAMGNQPGAATTGVSVIINSTVTVTVSWGGAGTDSVTAQGPAGTPNTGSGGSGNNSGQSGLVVLYT